MIETKKFPNAYREIYVILNNMSKEDVSLIPDDFMKMIANKMNKDWDFFYDESKDFKEQKILRETKAILGNLFLDYWTTPDQKHVINNILEKDIENVEEEKRKKYNTDDIFKNNQNKKNNLSQQTYNLNEQNGNNEQNSIQEKAMIEYKESIFSKIINKSIFWDKKIELLFNILKRYEKE